MDRLKESMDRGAWEEAKLRFRRLTEGEAASPTAEVWYLGAKLERKRGNLYGAAHLINQALALLPLEPGDLHAEVWFLEGLIFREVGDLYRAVPAFERVIRHSEAYPSMASVLLGYTHYNLALSHRQRNDHLLALSHYRQAADFCRQEGQHSLLVKTLQNMAWIYCLDNNPVGATELLEEAEPLVQTTLDWAHQRINLAYCRVLQGSIPEALRILQEVTERLEGIDPEEAAALAISQYVAGEACLRVGLLEQALLFASEADRAAQKAQDSRLMNLACGLRASVLQRREAAD